MTALVALYNFASVQMDDDFLVTVLFSLAGLLLSLALLSVYPDALAALGAY
jgi:hypothetical protein